MLNSETLEVGIGMAFLFLMVSLVCTAVKEWLEGVLKWRAMDLERALRSLLDDQQGEITAALFKHPLIYSLFQGHYDPAKISSSWLTPGKGARHMRLSARRNLPSYIPAGSFAAALLDMVMRGGADADPAREAQPMTIEALRTRALALPTEHLRRAVLTAIDHGAGDLERVRLNLQAWFDATMDRASGWYKRRTQAVLFLLGIATAAALNVDALYVMGRLTTDKTLRAMAVSQAAMAAAPAASDALAVQERIRAANAALNEVGMPIGWRERPGGAWLLDQEPLQRCAAPKQDAPMPAPCVENPAYSWGRVLIGWLVTAFGIMLGAPFWFDVLNKFMVIRSTVKPHEKSPEEGSEDRLSRPAAWPGGPAAAPDGPVSSAAAPPPLKS